MGSGFEKRMQPPVRVETHNQRTETLRDYRHAGRNNNRIHSTCLFWPEVWPNSMFANQRQHRELDRVQFSVQKLLQPDKLLSNRRQIYHNAL